MEKKFILYLLYISFIEMRERSYEANDKATFWLCDLLHRVPLRLETDDHIAEIFKELRENAGGMGMQNWFEIRKNEFYERFPEFKGKLG